MLVRPKRWKAYLVVGLLASTAGAVVGYGIALFLFTQIGTLLLHTNAAQHAFVAVQQLFDAHVFITMFTTSFTPVPDKIFIYAAGFLKVNFFYLLLATLSVGALGWQRFCILQAATANTSSTSSTGTLWFGGAVLALGVLYATVRWCILPFLG